jgi:hypothetical protein
VLSRELDCGPRRHADLLPPVSPIRGQRPPSDSCWQVDRVWRCPCRRGYAPARCWLHAKGKTGAAGAERSARSRRGRARPVGGSRRQNRREVPGGEPRSRGVPPEAVTTASHPGPDQGGNASTRVAGESGLRGLTLDSRAADGERDIDIAASSDAHVELSSGGNSDHRRPEARGVAGGKELLQVRPRAGRASHLVRNIEVDLGLSVISLASFE